MFQKILSIFIAVTMISSIGAVANAERSLKMDSEIIATNNIGGEEAQPMYNYVKSVNVKCNISSGQAKCNVNVIGYTETTTKIIIKMTLQKKTLLRWNDEQSWSSTTNGYTATLSKTKAVGSGTYRVKAEVTVYSGTKSELITKYSG